MSGLIHKIKIDVDPSWFAVFPLVFLGSHLNNRHCPQHVACPLVFLNVKKDAPRATRTHPLAVGAPAFRRPACSGPRQPGGSDLNGSPNWTARVSPINGDPQTGGSSLCSDPKRGSPAKQHTPQIRIAHVRAPNPV